MTTVVGTVIPTLDLLATRDFALETVFLHDYDHSRSMDVYYCSIVDHTSLLFFLVYFLCFFFLNDQLSKYAIDQHRCDYRPLVSEFKIR